MNLLILVLVLAIAIVSVVFAVWRQLALATYLIVLAIFLDGFLPHLAGIH